MIDVREDIMAFYLNERAYENRKSHAGLLYGYNFLDRVKRSLKVLILQLKSVLGYRKDDALVAEKLTKADVWVFYNTKNQHDSLRFIGQHIPNSVYVSNNTSVYKYESVNTLQLPLWEKFPLRYSFKYLPAMWKSFRANPRHFLRVFQFYTAAIGQYEVYRKMLRKHKPRVVVMSNDHTVHFRAMMHAGNREAVPTVFFQHASIKEDFPPMRYAVACLEGQDTLDKYRKIDPSMTTEVHLVGMPKFDKYFEYVNRNDRVVTLGVPYGPSVRVEDVTQLLRVLDQSCTGLEIIVRRHPADRRPISVDEFAGGSNRFSLSDPLTEDAFSYLRRTDMIVAGNSSIHLEATLLNIVSVYYPISESTDEYDVYGYVANGLVDAITDHSELTEFVRAQQERKGDTRHRAKYYYAPLGTPYDGRSEELAVSVIKQSVQNNT